MDKRTNQRADERDEHQEGLSLEELAERVDVPVRTIRFYISQGLLPGPGSRGKSATYGEAHMIRLRLIRRLADQHVPLARIAALLEGLSLDETRGLLAHEEQRASDLQAAEHVGSPKDYVAALLREAQAGRSSPVSPHTSGTAGTSGDSVVLRSKRISPAPFDVQPPDAESASSAPRDIWRRWTLVPGVELHVRGDALARYRDLIKRLLSVVGAASDPDGD